MPLLEICRIDRSNDSIEYDSIILNQLYHDSLLYFKVGDGQAYTVTEVSFKFGDEYLTLNNIRTSNVLYAIGGSMDYVKNIMNSTKHSNLILMTKDVYVFCELSFSQLDSLEDIALNSVCGGVMLRWEWD